MHKIFWTNGQVTETDSPARELEALDYRLVSHSEVYILAIDAVTSDPIAVIKKEPYWTEERMKKLIEAWNKKQDHSCPVTYYSPGVLLAPYGLKIDLDLIKEIIGDDKSLANRA